MTPAATIAKINNIIHQRLLLPLLDCELPIALLTELLPESLVTLLLLSSDAPLTPLTSSLNDE